MDINHHYFQVLANLRWLAEKLSNYRRNGKSAPKAIKFPLTKMSTSCHFCHF